MDSTVITRFAPSPTGFLHVGGARTALFNWLFAKANAGRFVLRVEDTDELRNTEQARDAILDGMRWLGLDWEGEPLYQSQRDELYAAKLAILEAEGHVYEDEGAIRFRVPDREIAFEDQVCGPQAINLKDTGSRRWDAESGREVDANPDIVIRRPDDSYIFHFANVVDDIDMGISHVLRGEDHLSNTPKHIALFEALGEKPPVFAHIPLILNKDGSKMSKRDRGAGLEWYRERGFLPQAVRNYLALLGWSPKDDREKLDVEEIVALFDFDHLNRSNAKFDLEKCTWLNGQYIGALSGDEFLLAANPFASSAPDSALALTQPRLQRLDEVGEWLAPILNGDHPIDAGAAAKVAAKPGNRELLGALRTAFAALEPWTADTIKAAIVATAESAGVKVGALMFPLRVAATGCSQGTDLMPSLEIIGREETIRRIAHRSEAIYDTPS